MVGQPETAVVRAQSESANGIKPPSKRKVALNAEPKFNHRMDRHGADAGFVFSALQP